MRKKDDKRETKPDNDRKEGKKKEREREKRIEIRPKKLINKNSVLSKFWLMRMPQKPK